MFVKRYDEGDFLILLLYVDDMLIVGQDTRKIGSLKKALGKSFSMKDLEPAKQILGMHIVRDRTKKVLIMVATREVCDKDLREILHVRSKASWLCIADKL